MEFSGSGPNISTFTTADQLHVAKKQDKAVQKKASKHSLGTDTDALIQENAKTSSLKRKMESPTTNLPPRHLSAGRSKPVSTTAFSIAQQSLYESFN